MRGKGRLNLSQHTYQWMETGRKAKHVEGAMFKYGTPVVTYVKCLVCGQMGYYKPPGRVVYTWSVTSVEAS